MGYWQRFVSFLNSDGNARVEAAVEPAPVTDNNTGWMIVGSGGGANDRDWMEMQSQYSDALEAYRKHPQAKRIIDLITDHVLGDGMRPSAPGQMGRFIEQFWTHRQNHMDMRLPGMVDELNRAGDLFVVLFRNTADGMSYVRCVPKSQIRRIETADNDWETEVAFYEKRGPSEEPRRWLSPFHPDAVAADAVMLHYAINRPVGALFGDGELATIIPWLLRYSRMLEDRVRLNWAARVFYWFVKVPRAAVQATAKKYKSPPEPGAIVVHDEAEEWSMQTPNLGASDATHDLHALRLMISAGSGQPPHWHGDSMDVNLATATAMERTAVRHLRRRQMEVADMITDLCHTAYARAYGTGSYATRRIPNREQITIQLPDIDRDDNVALAQAGKELAAAFQGMMPTLTSDSRTLREKALRLLFQFINEPLDEPEAAAILDELDQAEAEKPQQPQPPQVAPPDPQPTNDPAADPNEESTAGQAE